MSLGISEQVDVMKGKGFTSCKTRWFVSEHDFTGCGKVVERVSKSRFESGQNLTGCRKFVESVSERRFVSGHGFSRAVKDKNQAGISP
jgi:hypothetical protein